MLRPACTTPLNCLKDTFVELSDDVGFTTLFGSGYRYPAAGAACALTQGGVTLPDVGDDAFGVARSAPFSIGAHEHDGTCAAQ